MERGASEKKGDLSYHLSSATSSEFHLLKLLGLKTQTCFIPRGSLKTSAFEAKLEF